LSHWRDAVSRWTLAAVLIAVGVAIRALAGDPQSPWWMFAIFTATTPVVIAVACWMQRPRLLYVAAALLQFAATIAFIDMRGLGSLGHILELLYVNVTVFALPVPA